MVHKNKKAPSKNNPPHSELTKPNYRWGIEFLGTGHPSPFWKRALNGYGFKIWYHPTKSGQKLEKVPESSQNGKKYQIQKIIHPIILTKPNCQ